MQPLNNLVSCNTATPYLAISSEVSRDDVMEPGMLQCYYVVVYLLVGHGAVCLQMPYAFSSCDTAVSGLY